MLLWLLLLLLLLLWWLGASADGGLWRGGERLGLAKPAGNASLRCNGGLLLLLLLDWLSSCREATALPLL